MQPAPPRNSVSVDRAGIKPLVAVPDLHGHLGKLETVLEHHPNTPLLFLGDLIDHGPNSAQVLRNVRRLVEHAGATLLAGNHELLMLDALCGPPDAEGKRRAPDPRLKNTPAWKLWLHNGGATTLQSYQAPCYGTEALAEDARWLLQTLRRFHVHGEWLYSHATRPDAQTVTLKGAADLQVICGHDPLLWTRPAARDLPGLPDGLTGSVHGHTPHPQPAQLRDHHGKVAWMIDLGKHSSHVAVHHNALGVQLCAVQTGRHWGSRNELWQP